MNIRIGSLFSGYGGLEQGVQTVLGGTVAWHSEIDPGACKILAHRYPDVPNLGDITAVDWSAVEPVDVLTGGFPCQDVSSAGKRRGLHSETRSGLWAQMVRSIDELRPPLVVAENVRGLLSACALSELEPCPRCLGDESQPHRPVLRALGRVVGDLSELGYVGRWGGLRAADVGAPHGRFRVFVVAWPAADAGVFGRDRRAGDSGAGWEAAVRGEAGDHTGDPAGAPAATTSRLRGERRRVDRDVACPSGASEGHEGERERHGDAADDRGAVAADAQGWRESGQPESTHAAALVRAESRAGARDRSGRTAARTDGLVGTAGIQWGPYEAAIRRWERLTRPAPAPTEPGKTGQPRLSPAFVEWMMGLPAGWVTDVPGLGRNEQLKALGNGVVSQQCAAALRLLLPDSWAAAA